MNLNEVLRDGQWQEQDAEILVPGDIISIKLGDIIPTDARLLEGDPLKIDQSALTGESLPVTKKTGDEVFSSSTCKRGEIEAVVIATRVHSFFGKVAHLVDSTEVVAHFQKVHILDFSGKTTQFFINDKVRLPNDSPCQGGKEGELALAFRDLLRKLCVPRAKPVAPRMFKMKLSNFSPQFSGYCQHDSQVSSVYVVQVKTTNYYCSFLMYFIMINFQSCDKMK